MPRTRFGPLALLVIVGLGGLMAACSRLTDPLERLGLRATEGAAAGYVDDVGCRTCHASIFESYQKVGMARALRSPEEVVPIEDFGKSFYHEETQRHYRIERDGERLIFRRHQLDAAGVPINVFEVEIDWVLGSGNRARSYLFQTEWGELYQLPLGWYSETGTWGMSPGFEFADQAGVQRRVTRPCMFCHNAYPEVPEGSDTPASPDLFPEDLPQGTGCQRCHGPGAEHVRSALAEADRDEVLSSIVNPARLSNEQRDAVCFQCHMLPAVAVTGLRRFGRSDYSFRPGETLADYLVHVEVELEGIERADHFEINHHGYRFWQSRCYQESQGELACISCHDPHVKPESVTFREEVDGRCRDCHRDWAKWHEADLGTDPNGCVDCHMPTRRTRDVTLVTMTDHRIARGPFDREKLVEPAVKTQPALTALELLPLGETPEEEEGEIYRVASLVTALPHVAAVRRLDNLLEDAPLDAFEPHLALLKGQLKTKQYEAAEQTARRLLQQQPGLGVARSLLGTAQVGQSDYTEALESFEQALAANPTPEGHYNYALAALQMERLSLSVEHLRSAIALRPNMFQAWVYLGRGEARRGNLEEARDALVRSLEIEPSYAPAYEELDEILRRMEAFAEAERFSSVGERPTEPPIDRRGVPAPLPGGE